MSNPSNIRLSDRLSDRLIDDRLSDRHIDLNADVGELPERLHDGREAALLGCLSSANLACGGHAGDRASMTAVVRLCRRLGVAVGAHPSYPDREGFGRQRLQLGRAALIESLAAQLRALAEVAKEEGAALIHMKPHGTLYHDAADDEATAAAVAEAAARHSRELVLVGRAGSRGLQVYRAAGFVIAAEAFADRRYEPDGTLRPRGQPGALLTDPDEAAAQGLALALDGSVETSSGRLSVLADTLCVHSDTPGAEELAAVLRTRLEAAGVIIAALARPRLL